MTDNDNSAPPFVLTHGDVLGIIQRRLGELNMYLNQPAHMVQRKIVFQALSEIADFAGRLPDNKQPQQQDMVEQRAN